VIDDHGQLEEVVVSGFRSSLEKSLETKRAATNFVDSISDPDAILGDRPGDVVLTWLTRLHFGRWRNAPVLKALWALLGLIPALMLVTGVIMWWNRVLRKRPNVSEPNEVAV